MKLGILINTDKHLSDVIGIAKAADRLVDRPHRGPDRRPGAVYADDHRQRRLGFRHARLPGCWLGFDASQGGGARSGAFGP